MDERIEEHYLLKTYATKGLHARWFLIRSSFYMTELVNQNKIWEPLNQNQQLSAKCFLQLDIVSKMMMYTEDIAAFSWAFMHNKSFYDILDEINIDSNANLDDLGKKIKEFYESVQTLSDEQICKMMNYVTKADIVNLDEKFKEMISHKIKSRINNIRINLKMVNIFGKTNHPFHKRLKHAALPIFINTKIDFDQPYMKLSETYSIAYIEKKEPFSNPRVIPFSNDVLESYRLLCKVMDQLLQEIVGNKIECLERSISGIIPHSQVDNAIFSSKDLVMWRKFLDDYYSNHERKYFQNSPDSIINIDRKDYEWYSILNDIIYKSVEQNKEVFR